MTTITEYLAAQKRLADDATEGPWCVSDPSPFLPGAQPKLYAPNWKPIRMSESVGSNFVRQTADGRFIAAARESVPRLVAVLEAVTALHTKRDADAVTGDCAAEECGHEEECPTQTFETCAACWDLCEESDPYFGERGIAPVLWPCPTVRAIEAALGGEGE